MLPALFLELHSGFRPLCFVVLFFSRATICVHVGFLGCFLYFLFLPRCFLVFGCFFGGAQKIWISVAGNVFGASFGLQAMAFCGYVFFSRATI